MTSLTTSLPRIDHLHQPAFHDDTGLESRLGGRIAACLNEHSLHTPADISERLRFAREQALERARQQRKQPTKRNPVSQGTLGTQPSPWLSRLASALPLLTLVLGLMLIDDWMDHAQTVAVAELDSDLLADELPVTAYADAGFIEFLKTQQQ